MSKWKNYYSTLYGNVFKGEGFASRIDFPTVNIFNESKTSPNIYIVEEEDFGEGCAFVTPDVAEIHFFKKINCKKTSIKCNIVSKVERPKKSLYKNHISVIDIFLKGLNDL